MAQPSSLKIIRVFAFLLLLAVAAGTANAALTISISSPTNTTYNASSVALQFSGSGDNVSSCWYALDAGAAVSSNCTGSANLTGLTEGQHTVAAYINDTDGNNNSASISFSIDTATPTLTSVAIGSNNANPALAKTGDTVTLNFTASEPLFSKSVTIAGHTVSVTNAGGNSYQAAYQMIASDTEGTVPFTIDFTDVALNAGAEVNTSATSVAFDRTAPTLINVAMVSSNANPALAKPGDILTLSFNASEPLLSETVTIAGHAVSVTSLNSSSFKAAYTVSSSDSGGTVPFTIDFSDLAGNTGAQVTTASAAVTYFNSAVGLSSVTMTSGNSNIAYAKAGDTITLSFAASPPLQTASATIAGHAVGVTNASAGSYQAAYQMAIGDSQGAVTFSINYVDAAGNAGSQSTLSSGSPVTFDTAPPSLSSVSIISNESNTSFAMPGDLVQVSFTASEPLGSDSATIAGHTVSITNAGGNNYQALYQMTGSDTAGAIPFSIDYADNAGNAGANVASASNSVMFANSAPTPQPAPSPAPIPTPLANETPAPNLSESNVTQPAPSPIPPVATNFTVLALYGLVAVAVAGVGYWVYKKRKQKGLEGV